MYVKRSQQQQQQQHHHHHSVSVATSSVGGRTSPSPTHGSSNSLVLQSPVVQQIRAANCRGITGCVSGNGGGGQSALLAGGVVRNEQHPLARLAATVGHDVDDDDQLMTGTTEASLENASIICMSLYHHVCCCS